MSFANYDLSILKEDSTHFECIGHEWRGRGGETGEAFFALTAVRNVRNAHSKFWRVGLYESMTTYSPAKVC